MDSKYAKYAVFAGAFSGTLAGNAVLAIVPLLEEEFNLSAADVLLSISFYMFPFAIFSFFSGSISDIFGRRKVVTFGFIVYAAGALLCAFSTDITTFYVSRGVQGFGYAFVNPVLSAILSEVTPIEKRGRYMGFLAAATTSGVAFGPLMAGTLSTWDWRLTFIVIALLCFVCNVTLLYTYKGSAFRSAGNTFSSFLVNVPRAVKNRNVILISIIGFFAFFSYIGALSYVSDVLTDDFGASSALTGTLVALTGVAGMVAAPCGGVLVDKIGRARTATLGLVIVLLSMLCLIASSEIWMYGASLMLLGTGAQVLWAALFTLTVELITDIKGTVSSVFHSTRFMGYAISPLVLGSVYMASGYDFVLTITSTVVIFAIMLSFILGRK